MIRFTSLKKLQARVNTPKREIILGESVVTVECVTEEPKPISIHKQKAAKQAVTHSKKKNNNKNLSKIRMSIKKLLLTHTHPRTAYII